MGIETKKIELIDWIAKLKDPKSLDRLLRLKRMLSRKKEGGGTRVFGSGKHLVEHIANDFNDPLDIASRNT